MKKSITILAILVAVCAAFLFTACEEPADSAQDCMEGFVADANVGNFEDLHDYLHPDADQDYQSNYEFWETRLEDYTPLTLGEVLDITARATGATGESFVFELAKDPDDDDSIKITRITMDGNVIFQNRK